MIDWWAHHGPPVYASVAGYLGLIKKKDEKPKGLNDLLKEMGPGGVINGGVH